MDIAQSDSSPFIWKYYIKQFQTVQPQWSNSLVFNSMSRITEMCCITSVFPFSRAHFWIPSCDRHVIEPVFLTSREFLLQRSLPFALQIWASVLPSINLKAEEWYAAVIYAALLSSVLMEMYPWLCCIYDDESTQTENVKLQAMMSSLFYTLFTAWISWVLGSSKPNVTTAWFRFGTLQSCSSLHGFITD